MQIFVLFVLACIFSIIIGTYQEEKRKVEIHNHIQHKIYEHNSTFTLIDPLSGQEKVKLKIQAETFAYRIIVSDGVNHRDPKNIFVISQYRDNNGIEICSFQITGKGVWGLASSEKCKPSKVTKETTGKYLIVTKLKGEAPTVATIRE